MNYIGSKWKLLPFINSTITSVIESDLSEMVFCDLFAGTGIVERNFKSRVKKVIANDCEYYSYVLNKNYIGNHTAINGKEEYITQLNELPLIDTGFIYNNYCRGGGGERQYFSDYNGQKIDTVRTKIEEWKSRNQINDNLYYFLLASLLESADKLANTASVYAAYLKHLKASAQKELTIKSADFTINERSHEVFCQDANSLINTIAGDILYLDPPYNARQYGANYHLLNTIAEYRPFTPQGKTGLRDYIRSGYCSRTTVVKEFNRLIDNAKFKYIFLSYNNEGLMTPKEIESIMRQYGEYACEQKTYQRFKADKTDARNHKAAVTTEYLHILVKSENALNATNNLTLGL